MTDNIRPDHYRKGEIDLYEAWYRTYPFEQYRAIMQAIAERYMRRDKNNRVEDLGKAIYTLERLREKEIEHAGGDTGNENFPEIQWTDEEPTKISGLLGKYENGINTKTDGQHLDENYFSCEDFLKQILEDGYLYLARDFDGDLWMHKFPPVKKRFFWYDQIVKGGVTKRVDDDIFPEVKWEDKEPTKISDLLEKCKNG